MSEKVLDEENWKSEAQAVINDIKEHVKFAQISEKLKSTSQYIYINLTTLEGRNYCIELSAHGFRVVGKKYDVNELNEDVFYETPYSLLNKLSAMFCESFSGNLFKRLEELQKKSS